ncbi:helix-turn-helix domain-containing protein [Streptomyces lydicus]|uniref:helix-turn-helix domain-containing protein n=1 Tax=Streptomyces lydicus TaxID=47763 RepID=UPI0036D1839A
MGLTEDEDLPAPARAAFAAELTQRRMSQGLTKRALAKAMGFDPSYISHIESGRYGPTEEFARLAEQILDADQALWERWLEYRATRALSRPCPPAPPPPRSPAGPTEAAADEARRGNATDISSTDRQHMDLRGAQGLQFGNNSTQHNHF